MLGGYLKWISQEAGYSNGVFIKGNKSYHLLGICRYCRGAYKDNMEEDELPTKTQGSFSPFEVSAAQEEESMDQTLVIYTEKGTTKPSESVEEELVLPRLRVQFQDETSSEVRLHVKSEKKIFQNVFTMSASFFT